MAHQEGKVSYSPFKRSTETKAGLYADGAGLYLRIGRGGAKSWAFRYMLGEKRGH
jgi:hypothetical protein